VDLKAITKGQELPFLEQGAALGGPAVLLLGLDAKPEIAAGVPHPGLFVGAELCDE
jgi:hypothetical protein